MTADDELTQRVLDELNWAPDVYSTHIRVAAQDGVVTLTGHVESSTEKRHAERAALKFEGTQSVINEIEVRPA